MKYLKLLDKHSNKIVYLDKNFMNYINKDIIKVTNDINDSYILSLKDNIKVIERLIKERTLNYEIVY